LSLDVEVLVPGCESTGPGFESTGPKCEILVPDTKVLVPRCGSTGQIGFKNAAGRI
jgi:hypothetical protein